MHIVNPEETIEKLREAISKDKEIRQAHEEHIKFLYSLQKQETDIKEEISRLGLNLQKVQEDIVAALDVDFDYSDDTVLAAAEETLTKLEKEKDGKID